VLFSNSNNDINLLKKKKHYLELP